jgi:hypothetical protein
MRHSVVYFLVPLSSLEYRVSAILECKCRMNVVSNHFLTLPGQLLVRFMTALALLLSGLYEFIVTLPFWCLRRGVSVGVLT